MERAIQFHLEDFEGPLDLLLALIAKNKMNLYDIEIHTLIDQYLAVMAAAGVEETEPAPGADLLDTASSFIAMAARLVQMKSAMLLPRSEEAERMREELTGLLVEYSACKAVAAQLAEMAKGVFIAVRQPLPVELDTEYTHLHNPAQLVSAFSSLVGRSTTRRPPRAEQFDDIVAAPVVSVSGRIIHLLRGMVTGKVRRLKEMFAGCRSRGETVATFLALLELIRGGRVTIDKRERCSLQQGVAKRVKGEEAGNGA